MHLEEEKAMWQVLIVGGVQELVVHLSLVCIQLPVHLATLAFGLFCADSDGAIVDEVLHVFQQFRVNLLID